MNEHKKDCVWGNSDCKYKDTHNYCPHEEHKSLECKCFSPQPQEIDWEKEFDKVLAPSDISGNYEHILAVRKRVQDFIRNLLSAEREKVRADTLNEVRNMFDSETNGMGMDTKYGKEAEGFNEAVRLIRQQVFGRLSQMESDLLEKLKTKTTKINLTPYIKYDQTTKNKLRVTTMIQTIPTIKYQEYTKLPLTLVNKADEVSPILQVATPHKSMVIIELNKIDRGFFRRATEIPKETECVLSELQQLEIGARDYLMEKWLEEINQQEK